MPDVARTAVVLMNLGGPDRLEAVQPFLFNLFSDPAFKDGAFTANDPKVRAYALQKTIRAIDLGAERDRGERSPVARSCGTEVAGGRRGRRRGLDVRAGAAERGLPGSEVTVG